MNTPLRLLFAGTPAFAEAHLAALLASQHTVCAVLTQPDRPAGRGKQLRPSPVKVLAERHGLPVHQPEALDTPDAQALIREYQPDAMIVVAYGLLLPPAVLSLPRLGCINVHASLLPRWRGAAPIERAMLAGDEKTGISIMQMDAGLDTGPLLSHQALLIDPAENGAELTERLTTLGCQLLVQTLDQLVDSPVNPQPQDDRLSTYAAKLKKPEAQINWQQSAREVCRQIKALYPRMPAFTFLNGERLRITDAELPAAQAQKVPAEALPGEILQADDAGLLVACRHSLLRITRLQLPGKNPVAIRELLNARREQFSPGHRFSNDAPGSE